MIPVNKIAETEGKDIFTLNSEDLLILKYWLSYKECNLWYTLMNSTSCHDRAKVYAEKGRLTALQAIKFESEFKSLQERKMSTEVTKTFVAEGLVEIKILDTLLLNGSITESMYNTKYNQILKIA